MFIKASKLASVASALCNLALAIHREVAETTSFKYQVKGDLDFVTQADFRAQGLITYGLKHHFPGITVIGEETQTILKLADIEKVMLMKSDSLLQYLGRNQAAQNDQEYRIEDLVVWIDPLDGTLSFVKGKYDDSTCLIGVAVRGTPELAIMGMAFQKNNSHEFKFSPKVYVCKRQTPYFYCMRHQSIQKISIQRTNTKRKVFAMSTNKPYLSTKRMLSDLGISSVRDAGGFGKKTILLLQNEIDFFIYANKITSKWDSCCAEVVLSCLGARLTGVDGSLYQYRYDSPQPNDRGAVVCRGQQLLEQVLQYAKSNQLLQQKK